MKSTMRYIDDVVTLTLNEEACNGCTLCTIVCPHAVFSMLSKRAVITDLNACMECGACAKNCPTDAITVRAGVGCANGILMGKLGYTDSDCCCSTQSESTCC